MAAQRIVLLGASNLSRGFPQAVIESLSMFAAPLSIHAAMGPGRSYGIESGFFGKKLSGIFSSAIWESLEREQVIPTSAFVTDVGNDLAYGVPVDEVFGWVAGCVARLQSHSAEVILTALPMGPVERLTEGRFRVLRGIFYPSCRLTLGELQRRAEELNARLAYLAESQEMPIFTVPDAWFGFDPIHPQRRHVGRLWRALLGCSPHARSPAVGRRPRRGLANYLRCISSPGSRFRRSGARESCRRMQLFDGTRIALY